MTLADFIPAWANGIADFEGFNSPGSRPARNHNPGDLKFMGQAGASGQDSAGFAIFPDDATGWQALYRQLQKYVTDFPGYSLLEIMAHYLGQVSPTIDPQGNAFQYASAIARGLGATVNTTLAELVGMTGSSGTPSDLSMSSMSADDVVAQADPLPTTAEQVGYSVGTVVLFGVLAYLAWRSLS